MPDKPKASDLADQLGHTVADAKADHPSLDLSKPPASERRPKGNEMVLAQSDAEVRAQIGGADAD